MFIPVGRPRTRKPKEPETVLQAIFIKRVKEELAERQLNPRQFAALIGGPKERTIYDVLNRGAVPGLTVVHQVAVALNIPATELLVDKARRQEPSDKVHHLPKPPRIFGGAAINRTLGKNVSRNKSRA